jgi:hypothetical protein
VNYNKRSKRDATPFNNHLSTILFCLATPLRSRLKHQARAATCTASSTKEDENNTRSHHVDLRQGDDAEQKTKLNKKPFDAFQEAATTADDDLNEDVLFDPCAANICISMDDSSDNIQSDDYHAQQMHSSRVNSADSSMYDPFAGL